MGDTSKEIVPKSWLADDSVYDFWGRTTEGLTRHEISLLCAGLNPYHGLLFQMPGFKLTAEEVPKEVIERIEIANDISYKLDKHSDLVGRQSTAEWYWVFFEQELLGYFPVCFRPDRIAIDPEKYAPRAGDDSSKPRLNFMERMIEFEGKLTEAVRIEREGADYSKGMLFQYLEYDSWTPYEAMCLLADLEVVRPCDGESDSLEHVRLPSPTPLYASPNNVNSDYFEYLAGQEYSALSEVDKITHHIGNWYIGRFGTLRQQWIRDLSVPNDGLQFKEFYVEWAKRKNIEIRWLAWAKELGYFANSPAPAVGPDESISFRKETLLKVIVAMAMDAYGYKPGAARQTTALSESAGGIPYACVSRGVSVDADTLRNILRDAVELLPKPGS